MFHALWEYIRPPGQAGTFFWPLLQCGLVFGTFDPFRERLRCLSPAPVSTAGTSVLCAAQRGTGRAGDPGKGSPAADRGVGRGCWKRKGADRVVTAMTGGRGGQGLGDPQRGAGRSGKRVRRGALAAQGGIAGDGPLHRIAGRSRGGPGSIRMGDAGRSHEVGSGARPSAAHGLVDRIGAISYSAGVVSAGRPAADAHLPIHRFVEGGWNGETGDDVLPTRMRGLRPGERVSFSKWRTVCRQGYPSGSGCAPGTREAGVPGHTGDSHRR
jgi:hypothetical protein